MADDFDPTVLIEETVDPDEAAAELAAAEAEAEAEIAAAELAEAEQAAIQAAVAPEPDPAPNPEPEVADEAVPTADAAWELARVSAQSRVPGANPLDTVPAQSRINPDGSEIAR